MNFIFIVVLLYAFWLIIALINHALPKDKKHYSLILAPLVFLIYATIFISMMPKKQEKPHILPVKRHINSVEEVRIDILDSRTDKTKVQIVIYYKGCTDRVLLPREELSNFEKLNEIIKQITDLRDKTEGCK